MNPAPLVWSILKANLVGMVNGPLDADMSPPPKSPDCFDVLGKICLLPRFNKEELFFSLFKRVAEARSWPESAHTVMLQCTMTGRAQEGYSALSVSDGQEYECVK